MKRRIIGAVGPIEHVNVEARDSQIILTAARARRSDHVRTKLAKLALVEADIAAAVTWARKRR